MKKIKYAISSVYLKQCILMNMYISQNYLEATFYEHSLAGQEN